MTLKRALVLLALGATAAAAAIAPAQAIVPSGENVPPGDDGGAYVCGESPADQPTLISGVEVFTTVCHSYRTSFSVYKPGHICYTPSVLGRVVHVNLQNQYFLRWDAWMCATGTWYYSNIWPYNERRYSSAYIGPAGSYFEVWLWARP